MIYDTPPPGFKPRFDVVSCIVACQGKILLLHRQDHKPEGNTWCLPAGKQEEGETGEQALIREVFQETGLALAPSQLRHRGLVYVRYPNYDFTYSVYQVELSTTPPIHLAAEEHKDSNWVTPAAALEFDLIPDEDACIQRFLL